MLVNGNMCIYRIDPNGTAILEKMHSSSMIKDANNKSLSQQITSVTFCKTIPPKLDVESNSEHTKLKFYQDEVEF